MEVFLPVLLAMLIGCITLTKLLKAGDDFCSP